MNWEVGKWGSGEIELKPQNPKTPKPVSRLLSPVSCLLRPRFCCKLMARWSGHGNRCKVH
ncbi:hypothetical protein [Microcystis sp. BLCC-F210]|uniref:hypothetical protein n=1 Tax=Microcystis sp. BLCC-F210 TaxID=3342751 RepID=UPI0035C92935